jgi:pimeloyl-ACP methyl ester carboxylesterase
MGWMMDSPNGDLRHEQVSVGAASLHLVSAGDPGAPPVLFLHGWPECWYCWREVIEQAAHEVHAVAIDLPGVGGSSGESTDGSKRELARLLHGLIATLGLEDLTVVGQDVGGMIAYALLRAENDLARVVIMDVVVPGLDPWEEVLRNPYIWHFAFHTIPALPEGLVQGRQAEYFDYFYETIAADPSKITAEARAANVTAYASDAALAAGFNWYRMFSKDAADNREDSEPTETPLIVIGKKDIQINWREDGELLQRAAVGRHRRHVHLSGRRQPRRQARTASTGRDDSRGPVCRV